MINSKIQCLLFSFRKHSMFIVHSAVIEVFFFVTLHWKVKIYALIYFRKELKFTIKFDLYHFLFFSFEDFSFVTTTIKILISNILG
jgi:hypothetical protein